MKIIFLLISTFVMLFASIDDKILWQFSVISIFVSAIVILWNRRLAQEIKVRERIELELIKEQENLALALSGAYLSKWEWDVKDGTYSLDDKFYKLLGYKKEQIDKSIYTYNLLIHPNDKDRIKDTIIKHLKGESEVYQVVYRLRAKDGYKWVRITGKVVERDITKKATKMIGVAENIDDRMKQENKMVSIMEIIDKHTLTSVTDKRGKIVDVSSGFCNISGYSKEELIGKTHKILRDTYADKKLYDEMWQTIQEGHKWEGEIKNISKDGSEYWVYTYINPTYDEDGVLTGYVAVRDNITDQKRIEALLIEDDLTKLYNRRFFNQTITREFNRAKRAEIYFTFIIFDVDNFKKYNDNYGHIQGDIALREVADVLKTSFMRASDYVFRLGGEEFAVIFSDTSPEDAFEYAKIVLKRIRELAIEHKHNVGVGKDIITLSAGITTLVPTEDMSEDSFYKLSDEALYIAKNNGRDKIVQSTNITRI
jgi:diguanylate cyclase (GGDEF)-like protein/PAS domain S-box-containing protein